MNYIIEANLGIVLLYGIYLLLLKNETDFGKQRWFLVAGLVCSLFFPLINVGFLFQAPAITQQISTIVLPELVVGRNATVAALSASEIVIAIYVGISLILVAPLIYQGIRLYKTMRVGVGRYRDEYYVVESNENRGSWSFFKLIYIGRSNELTDEDKQLVVEHEMLHGKLLHSADMLFATSLCVVFWFNPVVWLYRKTLAKVHEFEVDAMVVDRHGVIAYSVLLAKTALNENGFLLTHHFNQSFILKRINMINMIKSKISNWKIAALVVGTLVYFAGVSCTDQVDSKSTAAPKDAPANAVEQFERLKAKYPDAEFQLAEFDFNNPGTKPAAAIVMIFNSEKEKSWVITENSGRTNEVYITVDQTAEPAFGIQEFYKQLGDVLQYPDESIKKGIEGKVFIEFVINPDGQLSDFVIKKGLDDACNTEAIRAIMQLGKWKPGYHNKQAVAQRLVLPITFKLDD